MNCFPPDIRGKIAALGHDQLAAAIELIHTNLLKARLPFVRVHDHAETEMQLYFGLCLVLWQVHLHRAERLMVSCGSCINNDDVYGLATLARGFVESTAVLIAVQAEMTKLSSGKTDAENFGKTLVSALIGTRLPISEEEVPAVNIMSYIKRADRFIYGTEKAELSSIYDRLSEYAHPNIDSNVVSFRMENGIYKFGHKTEISPAHVALLGHLHKAAVIFDAGSSFFQSLLARMAELKDQSAE